WCWWLSSKAKTKANFLRSLSLYSDAAWRENHVFGQIPVRDGFVPRHICSCCLFHFEETPFDFIGGCFTRRVYQMNIGITVTSFECDDRWRDAKARACWY